MIHEALAKFDKKLAMKKQYDNFIGGKWVPPVEGRYFSNVNSNHVETGLRRSKVNCPRHRTRAGRCTCCPPKLGAHFGRGALTDSQPHCRPTPGEP